MTKLKILLFLLLAGAHILNSQRIVSLSPSLTKTLFELQLGDQVAGVTDYCKAGAELDKRLANGQIKKVSGFNAFNFELILSVNPSHVLLYDSVSIEVFKQLQKLINCKIVSLIHPHNLDEVFKQIDEIAKLFGKELSAGKLIKTAGNKINIIQEKLAAYKKRNKPSVLFQIYYPPFTTVGINTFIADILRLAGGKLSFEIKQDWPTLSLEQIISAEPDLIIRTPMSEKFKQLEVISAYRQKKIFTPQNIDSFLQPGLANADAVEELFNYLLKNYYEVK